MTNEIFTIGHSTRPIQDFIALLKAHDVESVIDVRSIPRSRHNPQFEQDALRASLRNARIGYRWMKPLGGRRYTRKDSPNTGWENASFRGYADYMATDAFAHALERLEEIASKKRVAIMCAEAVPWRCHRSLIADALAKRKWRVRDISSRITAKRHTLTPFLKVRGASWYTHEFLVTQQKPAERTRWYCAAATNGKPSAERFFGAAGYSPAPTADETCLG